MPSPRSKVIQKEKKRKLCFSPSPVVHEYDINSPSRRRLDIIRSNSTDAIKADQLRIEMEMRGVLKRRNQDQGNLLLVMVNKDLREELCRYGLDSQYGTNKQLSDKIELAKMLRRRSHIRVSQLQCKYLNNIMPVWLPCKKLNLELKARRIAVPKMRIDKVEALEEALLKENDGLVGDGYDFGKRFVSVDEVVAMEDLTDRDLREKLNASGVTLIPRTKSEKLALLTSLIEGRIESQMRRYFAEELLDEIKHRQLYESLLQRFPEIHQLKFPINWPIAKIERLSDEGDSQAESPVDRPAKRKKTGPKSKTSPPVDIEREEPKLDNSIDVGKLINQVFDFLFESHAWKKDYPGIEEEPPLGLMNCVIS